MAEPERKNLNSESAPGSMLRDLKAHHNMFWESVKNFHLEGLLNDAYQNPARKKLIEKWLKEKACKRVLIIQLDFYCDPFLVCFYRDSWEGRILEDENPGPVAVELRTTHTGLIALTDSWHAFLFGWLRGEFQIPLLFKNFRDHYYALRIFLGG